jgi:hypothetical protein
MIAAIKRKQKPWRNIRLASNTDLFVPLDTLPGRELDLSARGGGSENSASVSRLAPQALSHDSSPLQALRRPDGGEVIQFRHGLGARRERHPGLSACDCSDLCSIIRRRSPDLRALAPKEKPRRAWRPSGVLRW